MRPTVVIAIFFAVVAAAAGALYVLQAPGLLTEAASPPAVQATGETSQCANLTGQALERCKLQLWYSSEQWSYDKGRSPEADASATAARGARGSGVEGVTSGGSTVAAPR